MDTTSIFVEHVFYLFVLQVIPSTPFTSGFLLLVHPLLPTEVVSHFSVP